MSEEEFVAESPFGVPLLEDEADDPYYLKEPRRCRSCGTPFTLQWGHIPFSKERKRYWTSNCPNTCKVRMVENKVLGKVKVANNEGE